MAHFEKILIANRGEIALRVIRTAHAMGFRTVAVYSEADHAAPHVMAADEAVLIGPAPVGQSYLNMDAILDAARLTGAEAVHPGYGFLSENANFARACNDAGLVFVGPSPEAIDLMGSKRLSKQAMLDAGVPCIPGYQGQDQTNATLTKEAQRIGFPLMIKASAGGGGRGMRIVNTSEELTESLSSARSEALSAFGSDELILERALSSARHIEVQVFADLHDNIVHLGERDCSIQRRHQKVVEEAPSPFVTPDLRNRLGEAAIGAARACGYTGAGTVEFLVDHDGNFYFLEMNTRLQVEHPVTEAITGQDLVEWQFRIALGEPLPLKQEEISFTGWAMEVRLYAEDPRNGFLPQTGKILHWQPSKTMGLRVDSGIFTGQFVSPHYDPMLAKLIVHGKTRDEARRKLARAVEESKLLGVTTNKAFLARILRHPSFAEGCATTDFLETHFDDDPSTSPGTPDAEEAALAAMLLHMRSGHALPGGEPNRDWRNATVSPWTYTLRCGDEVLSLTLKNTDQGLLAVCENNEVLLKPVELKSNHCSYLLDGVRRQVSFAYDGDSVEIETALGARIFQDVTHATQSRSGQGGSGEVFAPMDGAIVDLHVKPGDVIEQGQTIAILEAMKMEHPLRADCSGVLTNLLIELGDQVRTRQHLATITPDTITESPS